MQKLIVGEWEFAWVEHGGTQWSCLCKAGTEDPPRATKQPGGNKTHHACIISHTRWISTLLLGIFPAESTVVTHTRCWYVYLVWTHLYSCELLETNGKKKVEWGTMRASRTIFMNSLILLLFILYFTASCIW